MLTSNNIIHQNHRRREAGDAQVGKLVGGGGVLLAQLDSAEFTLKLLIQVHISCAQWQILLRVEKLRKTKQQKGDIALQLFMPMWMSWNRVYLFFRRTKEISGQRR